MAEAAADIREEGARVVRQDGSQGLAFVVVNAQGLLKCEEEETTVYENSSRLCPSGDRLKRKLEVQGVAQLPVAGLQADAPRVLEGGAHPLYLLERKPFGAADAASGSWKIEVFDRVRMSFPLSSFPSSQGSSHRPEFGSA